VVTMPPGRSKAVSVICDRYLHTCGQCRRRIGITPLCKIEVTLLRVPASRECAVAVVSMRNQEFSRLEVLLRVQSGSSARR
jgi:hypothetical protein